MLTGRLGNFTFNRLELGRRLFLNHQSGSSADAFEAVYPLFADAGFRAIGIDMPGMGNSDPPPGDEWSIAMFAEAVAAVITALSLDAAIIAGHHTGAGTTLRHATLFPNQVRGVVLHQLMLHDAATRGQFASNPIPPITSQRDGRHLLDGWHARTGAAGAWTMLEPMNRGVLDLLRASPGVAKSFAAALAYDAKPDLMTMTVPALILSNTGDRSHPMAVLASQLRPDLAYQALDGGGLDIMDEQPRPWADAVIRFARETAG